VANPTVFNAVATNPGGTGSTITVTLSTHAVGDLLIIYVANTGNVLWTGNPTGWSRIDQRTVGTSSNGIVGTWLWRKVVAGDSLPLTNPICTLGATVTRLGTCRTIRGADLESPFVTPNYGQRGFSTGTANPIRPPTVVTPAPEVLALHCYGARAATNAPDPAGYTQDAEAVVSGTLVINAGSQVIADQNTTLSNQDASPASGARWASGIICIPSANYAYYRAGSQATTASGTSVTPSLPAGTVSADVNGNKDLIIATVKAAGTPTITPQVPGDWTELGIWSGTTGGGVTSIRKYRALYDGSINAQFNRSTTGAISVCLTTYYNAHQTTPIGNADAAANASSTTSTWNTQNRSATKSTVTQTCVADGTPTFTAPSGWNERMDSNGITCADQTYNAEGGTPSGSFTLSAANPTVCGPVEILSTSSVAGATNLVVQGAAHNHSAGSLLLTQAHQLVTANGSHTHSTTNVTLAQSSLLTVPDSTHTHSADNPALSQAHALSTHNGVHSHSAEIPSLTQSHALTVSGASHSHTAESSQLVQAHELVVQFAAHAHMADSPTIIEAQQIAVQDTIHANTAESLTLTSVHELAVQDTAHGLSSENVVATQVYTLAVDDASHLSTSDEADLTQAHELIVADGAHSHASASIALTQAHTLVIDSSTHNHTAESVEVNSALNLAVESGQHAHVAEALVLTQVHGLDVAICTHLHASEHLAITQAHTLVIVDAVHGHAADNAVLGVAGSTVTLVIASTQHLQVATSILSLTADLTPQPTAAVTVIANPLATIVVQSKPSAEISKWA
jgi:hypothetical protein